MSTTGTVAPLRHEGLAVQRDRGDARRIREPTTVVEARVPIAEERYFGGTCVKSVFDATLGIYPTVAEEFVSLRPPDAN